MKPLFDVFRDLAGGSLSQQQANGINTVLSAPEASGWDRRWLAYALATAWHETGGRMQPVREGFAASDENAIRAVTRLFEQGRISRNYAARDPETGQSYYGRGLVQLTHRANYARAGRELGLPLDEQPDLALEPDVSAAILLRGMEHGWFTGKKLADYFGVAVSDPVGARRIVNGTDRADLIAGYHARIVAALAVEQRVPSVPPPPPHDMAAIIARLEALEAWRDRVIEAAVKG